MLEYCMRVIISHAMRCHAITSCSLCIDIVMDGNDSWQLSSHIPITCTLWSGRSMRHETVAVSVNEMKYGCEYALTDRSHKCVASICKNVISLFVITGVVPICDHRLKILCRLRAESGGKKSNINQPAETATSLKLKLKHHWNIIFVIAWREYDMSCSICIKHYM